MCREVMAFGATHGGQGASSFCCLRMPGTSLGGPGCWPHLRQAGQQELNMRILQPALAGIQVPQLPAEREWGMGPFSAKQTSGHTLGKGWPNGWRWGDRSRPWSACACPATRPQRG